MAKKKHTSSESKPVHHESASQHAAKLRQRKTHLRTLITVLAIIVLAGVGLVVYRYITDPGDNLPTDVSYEEDGLYPYVLEQLDEDELKVRVDQFRHTDQYEEARRLVEHQEGYDSNYDMQLTVAMLYKDSGAPQKAIDHMLNMIDTFGMTRALAENIADQAAEADKPDMARQYYEEAIKYIEENPDDYPLAHFDIEDIEKKIATLEDE